MNSAARQEVFTSYLNLLHHMRTPAQDVGTIQVFTEGFEVDSLPIGRRDINGFFDAARQAIECDIELLQNARQQIAKNRMYLHTDAGPIGKEDGVTYGAIWNAMEPGTDETTQIAGAEALGRCVDYELRLEGAIKYDLEALRRLAENFGHRYLSIETED